MLAYDVLREREEGWAGTVCLGFRWQGMPVACFNMFDQKAQIIIFCTTTSHYFISFLLMVLVFFITALKKCTYAFQLFEISAL